MQNSSTLLPSGFADLLPPYAWRERTLRGMVIKSLRAFGYIEVSPPLVEFEESLLNQTSLDRQTFRVMDATSQRMMGIRADMTPPIARIAASRMQDEPLPLRLCYSGTCLRVKGEGLHKSRQIVQAGVECIGSDDDTILIENLRCATETLAIVGLEDISLDVTLPRLVDELLQGIPKTQHDAVRLAIKQKDRHSIMQLEGDLSANLLALMDGATVESIRQMLPQLPASVSQWLNRIEAVAVALPKLRITLDPLEESGFGYYEGIAYSLFSQKLGFEIGRGGRYVAHDNLPAYGFTLYLTPLIYEANLEEETSRCLIAQGANEEIARDLREKGWNTLYATAKSSAELTDEAGKFNCSKILHKDTLTDV